MEVETQLNQGRWDRQKITEYYMELTGRWATARNEKTELESRIMKALYSERYVENEAGQSSSSHSSEQPAEPQPDDFGAPEGQFEV